MFFETEEIYNLKNSLDASSIPIRSKFRNSISATSCMFPPSDKKWPLS